MAQIGLIDVDGHHFPNLALMRISAYHKAKGDDVEWWWSDFIHYDIVYMSKVFSDQYSPDIYPPSTQTRSSRAERATASLWLMAKRCLTRAGIIHCRKK